MVTRFSSPALIATISQLSHPHICTLFDVGDGFHVMAIGPRRPRAWSSSSTGLKSCARGLPLGEAGNT